MKREELKEGRKNAGLWLMMKTIEHKKRTGRCFKAGVLET